MTKNKIGRCAECQLVDWINRESLCEFCEPTSEFVYATGMMLASTAPAIADDSEAA